MKRLLTVVLLLVSCIAKAQEIVPKTKVYLDFVVEENSVDPSDALDMFKKELVKLTSLVVVEEKKDAYLEFKVQVVKGFGDLRKAKFDILSTSSGEKIFESKWQKAGSSFQYGMSGTRGSIALAIKKQLIMKYPEVRW